MPYSKDINSYPSTFFGIYLKALEEPFEISCNSEAQRTSLIQQLHAFRRAAELSKAAGFETMRKVLITKGEGFKIHFSNRDHSIDNLLQESGINPIDLERFRIKTLEQSEALQEQYESEVDIFNKFTSTTEEEGEENGEKDDIS